MNDKFITGPITDRVDEFRKAIGTDNAKKTAFKANIGRAVQSHLRALSGTAASDNERLLTIANTIDPKQSDESFLESLKSWTQEVENTRARTLDTAYKAGKTGAEKLFKRESIEEVKQRQSPMLQQTQSTNTKISDQPEQESIARRNRIQELKAKQGK